MSEEEKAGRISALPLGIGSLPHDDPATACALILNLFPMSPFWPELPRRDWRESMGAEQARDLPGFLEDDDAQRLYFDGDLDITAGLGAFYEKYLAGEIGSFAVSPDFAAGLGPMMEMIRAGGTSPTVFKGQLTGPTTLGLILKDKTGKAILHDDQIMDVLVKATGLKAAWLKSVIAPLCEEPMIFFDEPMLQSIGSAAIPIDRATAVARLKEVVDVADCLTGGHCCGNTDWSILMEAGVDIIALDAWHFAESLGLYPGPLEEFFERGGYVAWGIVPASTEGSSVGIDDLYKRLTAGIDNVAAKTPVSADLLRERALITPSCGLSGVSESEAETILAKTAELASMIKA